MSAPEHLWPARPAYLRRGTPMRWLVGDGEYGTAGDLHLYPERAGVSGDATLRLCAIDLRDVTARAHAAMAYTKIGPAGTVEPGDSIRSEEVDAVWEYHARGPILDALLILARMRMLDEAVTVAEAREALAWAERVAGVAS